MDSQIEEIKNKLNVLDIVSSYIKLTKTGVNYRGLCPFHSEKGPSFFVSPARQMWKCFGCSKGGDIFEFVKDIEGVEFGDALRILASKAGVELKRENPQLVSERKRLYEICDLACSFFEKQLGNSGYGKEAEDYLLKRGITEESITKWRLGYSPDTWQGLSDFLVGRGYTRDEIVAAGLAVQSEKGNNPYDRFRGRIIFPIFDLNSQIIGFGARIFKEADKKETAKYINTPQTLLYDKSNVLYGINYAKLSIRKNNQCVLTEGYTDAIMCHQAGFDNTVAVSGTALTPRHLNTLKRYTDNLLLSFDMDVAGDTATKRGINLAESQGFNIKVVDTYSGAKDPAEIILENPENWGESVKNARSIMDFYFDSAFAKIDKNTPQGKKEISKIILPAIKVLQNKIEQSFWVQKLAEKLNVSQDAVIEELKVIKLENNLPTPEINTVKAVGNNFTSQGRKKLLEDRIISLVFKDPYNLNLIKETDYSLFCEPNKKFIEELKNSSSLIFAAEETGAEDKLKTIFSDISQKEEYKDTFGIFSLLGEAEPEGESEEEVNLCLFQLKRLELKNELGMLSGVIKNDPNQHNQEHLKEFARKAKELHQKT
ncbi:MAG: DNA primase [Candidatus Staskawiczbacteria bacterium]